MTTRPILPLPPQTIDRIAAGEVIQRPSAIIKELIENSLDASSTSIDVHTKSSNTDLSVSDNGCGIDKDSLQLACTRFATSKIVNFEDLRQVTTFGFRGEALASCSMVGRVSIVSRRKGEKCAYRMNYRDGSPVDDSITAAAAASSSKEVKPKPCAGKDGTTIHVQDLFYNVPSRRRALSGKRNEREEYDRILSVVQRYAVHEARRGVGFLCRGGGNKGGRQCDLNTQSLSSVKNVMEKRKRRENDYCSNSSSSSSSLKEKFGEEEMAAVKEVIGHVFGSEVIRELLPLSAGEGDVDAVALEAAKAMLELNDDNDNNNLQNDGKDNNAQQSTDENNCSLLEEMMMSISNNGQINKNNNNTKTSTKSNNSNDDATTNNSKSSKFSFAYKATGLITNGSYSAPKSSAAFLLFINDRLVESPSLRRAVESVYADTLPTGCKPFVYLSLELPGPHVDVNVHPTKREVALLHEDRLCDALMTAVREVIGSATSSRTFVVAAMSRRGDRVMKQTVLSQKSGDVEAKSQNGVDNEVALANDGDDTQNAATLHDENTADDTKLSECKGKRKIDGDACAKPAPPAKKAYYDPSRLVRTNRAALTGALEPFLVKKDSSSTNLSQTNAIDESKQPFRHEPECSLFNQPPVDMSLPGAFATAICRCQVHKADNLPPVSNGIAVRSNPTNGIRPKKVTPTECIYTSVIELRDEVSLQNHQPFNETLRASTYIGAVSRHRSLIQSGIDLLMINHRELACETFYQLALLKFGDVPMAELGGGGVHVRTVIADYLQSLETDDLDDSSKLTISETNSSLARQTVKRLAEKAPMLLEYFSIKFEIRRAQGQSQRESLWLTGLPILLEGHSPQPYALPQFLLRLANEVDWTSEKPCFKGICKEIGCYYSELPITDSDEDLQAAGDDANNELVEEKAKAYIKHTLYPTISHLLIPPQEFAAKGSMVKLASLTMLYKVFERC